MFYSQAAKLINTEFSYLAPEQVFAGQYWDEFGITPHLVPDRGEVLMLGLAAGGGIRPILTSHKSISVTAIDICDSAVTSCLKFYAEIFPDIKFDAFACDALDFLENTKKSFDAIWVDLYSEDSYSPLNFNERFHELIRNRLTPDGVVLINAYGLPFQFSPLKSPGPQARLTHTLQQHFHFVSALPFRRNLTLIASRTPLSLYPYEPHPGLNELDRLTHDLIASRLRSLSIIEPIEEDHRHSLGTLSNVNSRLPSLWQDLVLDMKAIGIEIGSPVELLALIQDRRRIEDALETLINCNLPLQTVVPILCAGESNLQELNVDWIFAWYARNHSRLSKQVNAIWIAQLWSMILQPSRRFQQYRKTIEHLLGTDT